MAKDKHVKEAAQVETRSTELPLTYIEGLSALLPWGKDNGSQFAAPATSMTRKTIASKEVRYTSTLDAAPIVEVELTNENIEGYRNTVKQFNEALNLMANRLSSAVYTRQESSNRIEDAFKQIEQSLGQNSEHAAEVATAVLDNMIELDYRADSYRRGTINLYMVGEISRNLRSPVFTDLSNFEKSARTNIIRSLTNPVAAATNISSAELLSLYPVIMESAEAFVSLKDVQKMDFYPRLRQLSVQRKSYGSVVVHFVRTGTFDLHLYKQVVYGYIDAMSEILREASSEMCQALHKLSEVNWLTSEYIFNKPEDMFMSKLNYLFRGKQVFGAGPSFDDDCPF